MNIRHLEHLLAVAETGSFSRAAERAHITQSALSRSIQALEEDLGGLLVDRIGKRNELTALGQDVVARARSVVRGAAICRFALLSSTCEQFCDIPLRRARLRHARSSLSCR